MITSHAVTAALLILIGIFVVIILGGIAYGVLVSLFTKKTQVELSHDRRRRVLYLVRELEKELDEKKEK